ncbi:MAG: hypothetical protein RID09_11385 [Coleofasciculus sp. G1-WW12-02]|uniref:CHASE3 domain-containing protein n=1 Tax=Coleofasciculus sp. G1-WW12-02 TaxID=3068483 RepID=UPI0032F36046
MKLRTKILAGYGATLLLVVLVCGWGVVNLRRLGKTSEAILRENYRSILAKEVSLHLHYPFLSSSTFNFPEFSSHDNHFICKTIHVKYGINYSLYHANKGNKNDE